MHYRLLLKKTFSEQPASENLFSTSKQFVHENSFSTLKRLVLVAVASVLFFGVPLRVTRSIWPLKSDIEAQKKKDKEILDALSKTNLSESILKPPKE